MTLTIEEFYQELQLDVSAQSEASGDLSEDAFFSVATSYLIDSGDISECQRVSYVHIGLKIDGYTSDPRNEDSTLTVLVLDYHQLEDINSLRKADLDALCKRATNFVAKCTSKQFVDSLEESSAVSALAELIYERWSEIKKIRVIVLTNRVLKIRSSSLPDLSVKDISCSVSLWDLSRLYQYCASGKSREDILVDLANEFGGPLATLSAHLADTDYKSYLVVMPGLQLAKIYERWGTQLLEKNVRVFLQARGKVNKGIRDTIDNDPTMMFAYNNGITATAESVKTEPTKYGLAMSSITNLQIVNGGQTTASVFDAWRRNKDLSKVFVQMKLSVVDPAKSEEIVPRISEYANSQNKVNAADFYSNHPFHVAIEKFSRQITAPRIDGTLIDSKWFYERARGQYVDERAKMNSNSERSKFDIIYPRRQLITKTDLAKYLNTWRQKPDLVSRGAQRNFAEFAEFIGSQWRKDPEVFNDVFYKHSVAKAILFRTLEKIVSIQEWYRGGYRANVVIYTLSLLSQLFSSRNKSFDFTKIWQRQEVHDDLAAELTRVAHDVYRHITSPPQGSPTNVTEYAKTSKCWQLLLECDVKWSKSIDAYVIAKSSVAKEQSESRMNKEFKGGVEAQLIALKAGSEFWSKLFLWSANTAISSRDKSLLRNASSNGFYPTAKQASDLLNILNRCQEIGYPEKL